MHKDFTIDHTDRFVHVSLASPRTVLSTAVLGGGMSEVSHLLNLRVDENFLGTRTEFESPEVTLESFSREQGWEGPVAGMMTSAHMKSFRQMTVTELGAHVTALVTSGLSNARRAGDPADWRHFADAAPKTGTINIITLTNARLTPACLAEALCITTEAKAGVLQEMGIKSRISDGIATGTGTDSTAVVSGHGTEIRFCGKHVLFGEMLAHAVSGALRASLTWYTEQKSCAPA